VLSRHWRRLTRVAAAAASGPSGAAMTRREPLAFSARAAWSQPSAWARDLEYAGALVGAAVLLMVGFLTLLPTPRRRSIARPAPAWERRRNPLNRR
jgi:hypothetical protein